MSCLKCVIDIGLSRQRRAPATFIALSPALTALAAISQASRRGYLLCCLAFVIPSVACSQELSSSCSGIAWRDETESSGCARRVGCRAGERVFRLVSRYGSADSQWTSRILTMCEKSAQACSVVIRLGSRVSLAQPWQSAIGIIGGVLRVILHSLHQCHLLLGQLDRLPLSCTNGRTLAISGRLRRLLKTAQLDRYVKEGTHADRPKTYVCTNSASGVLPMY